MIESSQSPAAILMRKQLEIDKLYLYENINFTMLGTF